MFRIPMRPSLYDSYMDRIDIIWRRAKGPGLEPRLWRTTGVLVLSRRDALKGRHFHSSKTETSHVQRFDQSRFQGTRTRFRPAAGAPVGCEGDQCRAAQGEAHQAEERYRGARG